MSVSFHPEPAVLLPAVSAALAVEREVEVTGLPPMDGFTPALEGLWIFRFDTTVEVHAPASVSYAGSNRDLSTALSSPPLPGGFRLLSTFQASDAALARAVAHLIELVREQSEAEPGRPAARVVSSAQWRRRNSAGGAESTGADERGAQRPIVPHRPVESLTALDEVGGVDPIDAVPDADALAGDLALVVKGQSDALRVVSEAVVGHLHRVAPRRPLSVLLVGRSGVGKTETFEALGAILADIGGWNTVRVDGNQLKEAHTVADLLGAPAGYVGHGQGSPLVHALSTNPRTLVLIDEIGQAHPDISVALMGVMDHGYLQLRQQVQGRWQLDCRQAVFLFTTNDGAPAIIDRLGQGSWAGHHVEELARQVLMAEGMPEWIAGRHGRVAVYRPLPVATLAEIATLEVRRLAEEFGLDLAWVEPELVGRILAEANATSTGARALRGAVERLAAPAFVAFRRELVRSDQAAGAETLAVVALGPEPEIRRYDDWVEDAFEPPADDHDDRSDGAG